MQVGFIGLGHMGQHMARHVAEAGHHVARQPPPLPRDATQLGLFAAPAPDPLLLELDGLDVNSLSPLDALNRLAAWQKRRKEGGS